MAALIVAMSLTLAACGSNTSTEARSIGTLTGRVTAAPTCPVERANHPCQPAPVSATVQAKRDGRVIASTHTDASGGYRVQLRPGAYTVVAVPAKAFARCSPVNATVKVNRVTRAAISCDTGIR